MGLFDVLFGPPKPANVQVMVDRIWMTTQAKFAGISKEVAERSKSDSVAILLVAHFPDVKTGLQPLADPQSPVPIMAVLASDLSSEIATNLRLSQPATIDILVGERHPLHSTDDGVLHFAAQLPCRCRLAHHMSLEDPVMKPFAGDWIQNILGQLGLSEDEPIKSELVSRRIKQAQRKIEEQQCGNLSATSAAEWLEKNCPALRQP